MYLTCLALLALSFTALNITASAPAPVVAPVVAPEAGFLNVEAGTYLLFALNVHIYPPILEAFQRVHIAEDMNLEAISTGK